MYRVEAQHPSGYWFEVPSVEDQENLGLQAPAAEFKTLGEAADFQAQEHKEALTQTGIDVPFRIVEVKVVEEDQYRRFQRGEHRQVRSSWMRAASRLLL